MAVPTTSLHQHSDSKKCTSATCCSPSKIWRAIQTAIATNDKKGLATCFQDKDRIPHITSVLLKERNINDAMALPPSHKHRVLQFDKSIRKEAASMFGKSVVDLNALQVALFYQREDIACQLLQFLRQHASPTEMQSFLGHVWGRGNSSLHLACFHGMPRLVNLLLELGADPHVTNACHFKPADCCKDPGCLAALEKATSASTLEGDAAEEEDPAPVAPPARRHSAALVSSPSSALKASTAATAASVSLKRQASLPGLNTRASSEKKARPGTPTSPTTPTTRSMAASQRQETIKEAPKTPSALALLHDKKAREQQQHRDRPLPTPVMRSSLALRPTPETERPVSPPAEEEDHPAAQQQHHQQPVNTAAPTVTADSVNTRHPPERSHYLQHSQLAEPVGLPESASAPPLSLPPSLTTTTTCSNESSNNDVTSVATSPPSSPLAAATCTADGGGGGGTTTSPQSSSSPSSATTVVVETIIPDKQRNLQQPPPAIKGTYLGVSNSTTTGHHPHQQQKQQQQRVNRQGFNDTTLPPVPEQTVTASEATVRIITTDSATTLDDSDDSNRALSRLEDITIACAVQHLANVFNFTTTNTKGIYEAQQFHGQQEQDGATMTDTGHEHYFTTATTRFQSCARAAMHHPSLTGDSQAITEQQQPPCVAVL